MERRTNLGIYWKDEHIGVTDETVYGLNAHFFPDGNEKRVRHNGWQGWEVGYCDPCNEKDTGGVRLVVADGDQFAVGIHESRIIYERSERGERSERKS